MKGVKLDGKKIDAKVTGSEVAVFADRGRTVSLTRQCSSELTAVLSVDFTCGRLVETNV